MNEIDHSAYERPALGEVKIGDTVYVFRPPVPNRTIIARIAKIGRVWLDIDAAVEPGPTWRMRMDTQHETAGPNPRGSYFLTPAQLEWTKRRNAAIDFLEEQGITVGTYRQHPWRAYAGQIHLAELLKAAIEREVNER